MGPASISAPVVPLLSEPGDELFTLQLRVARKADELALTRRAGAGLNLHCWLLAEAELLGGFLSGPLTVARTSEPPPAVNRD